MNRMWCSNCNQWVMPQKKQSNRGGIFLVLLLLGVLLLFVGIIPGLIVLGVAVVYLVVGAAFEVGEMLGASTCPICKDTNLSATKPTKD